MKLFEESEREKAERARLASILERVSSNDDMRKLEDSERSLLLSHLRQTSRSAYLHQREESQLDLLRRRLEAQDAAFEGANLSSREAKLRALDQKFLNFQAQLKAARPKPSLYVMPLDAEEPPAKKMELLKRYEPHVEEANPGDFWVDARLKLADPPSSAPDASDFLMPRGDSEPPAPSTPAEEPKPSERPAEGLKVRRGAGPKDLPIHAHKKEILETVQAHPVMVLMGETGSGKSTQLPQFLLEAAGSEGGQIVITQPRRIAAISVAARVAAEMGVALGGLVGYRVRFEEKAGPDTRILFVTDGILMREFLRNPTLEKISTLVVDEAHERSVNGDIIFALAKDLTLLRPDFRLIIASATMDPRKFSFYFRGAPVVDVPGRKFPVDIFYSKAPEEDYVEAGVITVLQIHLTQPSGDVLFFLTGEEDIELARGMLSLRARSLSRKFGEIVIVPLHGSLSSDQQALAFAPTPRGARKVVLATNIAETSITIPGICFVIDGGLSKQTAYDPRKKSQTLAIAPISRASADQRAGRAGRTKPGKCFRLYTLYTFQNELDDEQVPEIQRCDLTSVILQLKSIGIDNFVTFDFMDSPHPEAVVQALNSLNALGVVDDAGELTPHGKNVVEFPIPPQLATSILASEEQGVTHELCIIAGILSSGYGVYNRPHDQKLAADRAKLSFAREEGDHLSLLQTYRMWELSGFSESFARDQYLNIRALRKARDISEQLLAICAKIGLKVPEKSEKAENTQGIVRALVSGYFSNAAQKVGKKQYRLVKGSLSCGIHPSSFLAPSQPPFVIFEEIVMTSKDFLRTLTKVSPEILTQQAPHYFKQEDFRPEFEEDQRRPFEKSKSKSRKPKRNHGEQETRVEKDRI